MLLAQAVAQFETWTGLEAPVEVMRQALFAGAGGARVSRYSRQELFAGIGPRARRACAAARVLVVGCGALGSSLAEMMVRAGVGASRWSTATTSRSRTCSGSRCSTRRTRPRGLPKAVAAEARLRRLNSDVAVRGIVADLSADNVRALVGEADLVLDGTDNFETRFLLNDVCLRGLGPWVYGACVGAYGLALAVRPRVTPCLRCVLRERPAPGPARPATPRAWSRRSST